VALLAVVLALSLPGPVSNHDVSMEKE
jgi:hypothetical protein